MSPLILFSLTFRLHLNRPPWPVGKVNGFSGLRLLSNVKPWEVTNFTSYQFHQLAPKLEIASLSLIPKNHQLKQAFFACKYTLVPGI